MSDIKDYSKLIEQAEKAVSSVKDESLRKIAFEKLLSHLLSDNSEDDEDIDDRPKLKKTKSKSSGHSDKRKSKAKKEGPKGWLRELVAEGFFSKPKSSSDILEELENRSHHLQATDLTRPLQLLCHEKLLRRKKMASEKGGKAFLHWVNW